MLQLDSISQFIEYADIRPKFARTLIVSNGVLLRDAVVSGVGVGHIAHYALPYYPQLIPIMKRPAFQVPVYLAYHTDTLLSPGADKLLDILNSTLNRILA